MRANPSFLITAAALCCATVASADDGRRIAVVVASQVNASAEEASATAAALEHVLEERGETVTPWAQSSARLPVEGLPADCLTVPSCIRDLGQTLGAEELLFLSVVRVGASVQVDVSWASASSGESAVRARVALSSFESTAQDAAFRAEADRILPRQRGPEARPTPQGATTGATPAVEVSNEPSTGRHLTQGVWIAGGIGTAAFVGATALGLYTRSLYKDCMDSNNCDNAELDDVDRTALMADVLLVGSIAAGATAAVLYYRSDRERPPAVTIAPTRGGMSIGVRAHF